MGIDFDGLKDKAEGLLREHSDQIEGGLDKAGHFAKSKFAGHDEQIDSGIEKAKSFLDKFDSTPDEQPPPAQ